MHALDELSYRQFIPQFELLGCRLRIHSKSNKNFIPIVSLRFCYVYTLLI